MKVMLQNSTFKHNLYTFIINQLNHFLCLCLILVYNPNFSSAQDTIRYTGTTMVNVDYHHGQLSPAMGVHNIQVMRANREQPDKGDGYGWTYNHAPMLAYWNNTFYLEYLNDSVGEHIPPSQTLLVISKDGYQWSKPVLLFPPYKVPDGITKPGYPGTTQNMGAIMHQRMGFYVSKKGRLLALAFYGICLDGNDSPNDGNGIGRVVREVFPDGRFGPVYFIRYNHNWSQQNTYYPFYTASTDKGFVEACNELMDNQLMIQQWQEEADRDDPLIRLRKLNKAFCYYHIPDGRVVGLWKWGMTSISNDDGKTWLYAPVRAPKFVTAGAKIWGQRTSDGRYATVYNPSEFRWPLAISTSDNGLEYSNLLLVHGEISPFRYGGHWKNYGPQYVRGIEEGNGIPPDKNLWVTYSMNKEDIWVASIPIPVEDRELAYVSEEFNSLPAGEELKRWNIYSPLWCPVKIEQMADSTRWLALIDRDKYDFAKAERLFPASKKLKLEFSLVPAQNNRGLLHIELLDAKGAVAVRLVFDSLGSCKIKTGYDFSNVIKYEAGKQYEFRITFDTDTRFYTVNVNGKDEKTGLFFSPVRALERIVFRTGDPRYFPNAETPSEQSYDLPQAGIPVETVAYYIKSLKTYE